MTRPPSGQGGSGPYVIDIDSLAVDDFAIATLSTPLTADGAKRLVNSKFEIVFISFRADQLPSIVPRIANEKLTAFEIYLLEGSETNGRSGFTFGTEIEFFNGITPVDPRNLSFLWPVKQCND